MQHQEFRLTADGADGRPGASVPSRAAPDIRHACVRATTPRRPTTEENVPELKLRKKQI